MVTFKPKRTEMKRFVCDLPLKQFFIFKNPSTNTGDSRHVFQRVPGGYYSLHMGMVIDGVGNNTWYSNAEVIEVDIEVNYTPICPTDH